jgi:hypothetical protein
MNGLTSGLEFFHSPFDKLRANGKIQNLMAEMRRVGMSESRSKIALAILYGNS